MAKLQESALDRIVRCAVGEFSRVGYSGARVDRIAAAAGLSKGMIYYHFKSKEALFASVLEAFLDHGRVAATAPNSPVESILFWSDFYQRNRDWARLMAWEGLELRSKKVLSERKRRAYWESVVEKMRANLGRGGWPEFLDCEQYLLAVVAVEMTPILLPHLCRMITGKDPEGEAFRHDRATFLRTFAQFIQDQAPPAGPAQTQ